MIEFPCKCGFRFKLDDEQAGGTIQCDRCGLLSDIPLHQDLAAINEDGTYKMDESPTLQNPQAAADLIYVFTRGAQRRRRLRKGPALTTEEFDAVGTGQPLPLHPRQMKRLGPKYDPETGELITEFQIANDGPSAIDPATVPMATATLQLRLGTGRLPAIVFKGPGPPLLAAKPDGHVRHLLHPCPDVANPVHPERRFLPDRRGRAAHDRG